LKIEWKLWKEIFQVRRGGCEDYGKGCLGKWEGTLPWRVHILGYL